VSGAKLALKRLITMLETHIISHNDGITKVKFLVKPTLQQSKSIIDEIAKNHPSKKRLWDLSEVKFDLTIHEIILIAEYGKQKFTNPSKIALYVIDDLAYGKMRQFEVYRQEEKMVNTKIFRNAQEAIAWLNS
jgi:cellobiose-specific phosphotransferase system component IIB